MAFEDEAATRTSRVSVMWRASEFVQTVTGALWSLRSDDSLVDVTLSCEGRTVRAHRVLLAACSPYLKRILQDNPCRHPVLIFRDLEHDDLHALLRFMYHGEVSVPQNRLASFLAAADMLQVRGLTEEPDRPVSATGDPESKSSTPDRENGCASPPASKRRRVASSRSATVPNTSSDLVERSSQSPVSERRCEDQSPVEDVAVDDGDNNTKDSVPDLISLEGLSEETNQDGDEVKFRCQVCWKSFKHPISLSLHKDSHTGKTQCPICHRFFSRSYDMRCHLTKIHHDQTPEFLLKLKPSIENNT